MNPPVLRIVTLHNIKLVAGYFDPPIRKLLPYERYAHSVACFKPRHLLLLLPLRIRLDLPIQALGWNAHA